MTEKLSSDPGPVLFVALKAMFDQISQKDKEIKELKNMINNKTIIIDDLSSKLSQVEKNFKVEKDINTGLVLKAAKNALMVSGD